MTIDKKELTKLSPEQRIKKLKLMEQERRKEVAEIEALIKESMQALKTDKIAEEVAPEQRAVDISRLFETSGEQRLERTAREEAHPAALAKGTRGYVAFEQVYGAYQKLKGLYDTVSMGGSLSEEQKIEAGKAGERLIQDRYSTAGEEVSNLLNAGLSIFYKLEREVGLPRRLRS